MEEKTAAGTAEPPGTAASSANRLPLLERCWSEATRDHFRNSRIEFLKGMRSLIDERIAHLSKEESLRART